MMKIAWTIRAQKRVIEILEYSNKSLATKQPIAWQEPLSKKRCN